MACRHAILKPSSRERSRAGDAGRQAGRPERKKNMKRYNPTKEILNAICALDKGEKILVAFEDGRVATYSFYMLDLFKTDPTVSHITSKKTGELYYYNI